jgi:hypothetical protein
VWLEDIVETARPWPLSRYGLAARHLGIFNGRFLVDRPLPPYSWLSSRLLRSYLNEYEAEWVLVADLHDSPLARRGWPADQLDRMRRQWDAREELLAAEAWLPRTLCQGDTSDVNLLARKTASGSEQTVAVDWVFTGVGPIGQDLASLLRSALGPNDPGDLPTFDQTLFAGYLDGLRVAGWKGDQRLARLGFCVAASLRYGLNPTAGLTAAIIDEGARGVLEEAFAMSFADLLDRIVKLRDYCLQLAAEARELYGIVRREFGINRSLMSLPANPVSSVSMSSSA